MTAERARPQPGTPLTLRKRAAGPVPRAQLYSPLTYPLLAGLADVLQLLLLVLAVLLVHLLHPLDLQLKPLAELGGGKHSL